MSNQLSTGNYSSLLSNKHRESLPIEKEIKVNREAWEETRQLVLEAFPDAGIRTFPRNKKRSVNVRRVKQALFMIMIAQSSRTTENEYYRGFLKSLASEINALSEKEEN